MSFAIILISLPANIIQNSKASRTSRTRFSKVSSKPVSRAGLPLAFQLVGRPFDEATVLRLGHAYQQATDWHTRRPALGG